MAVKKILIRFLSSVGLLVLLYAALVVLVYYTSCTNLSEAKVVEFAQSQIEKKIRFLVQHFKEPVADVRAGRFVLLSFLDSRFSPASPFAVMYQTPSGQLVEMEINVSCGVRWSYPHAIIPREESIFVRDLRTGQQFIRRSTLTGTSPEPGTEASHSGAIQLPGGPIRP